MEQIDNCIDEYGEFPGTKASDYGFAVDNGDGFPSFMITSLKYWEEYGHFDDQVRGAPGLPDAFSNLMEATFEYYDPRSSLTAEEQAEEGVKLLLAAGFIHKQEWLS